MSANAQALPYGGQAPWRKWALVLAGVLAAVLFGLVLARLVRGGANVTPAPRPVPVVKIDTSGGHSGGPASHRSYAVTGGSAVPGSSSGPAGYHLIRK